MEMIKVESSNIERIGYKDKLLRVEFKGKDGTTTYDFPGCPLKIYNSFLMADSMGKFFAKNVRGEFETRKVSNTELILEKAQELVEDSRLRWKDLDKKRRLRHLDQIINLCMSAAECENKS